MTSLSFGPVVLGGNVFGWTVGPEDAFAVLDAFLDGGGRAIDTADSYVQFVPGNVGGESESQIGEWLAARGCRDRVDIHTKVHGKRDRPGLSARNIVLAAEDSLRRLQTDHIDLYYAHRDDPEVPQEEYIVAFDSLVRAGKVREVGASNFSSPRLRSALEIAADAGSHRLHRRPGPVEPRRTRRRARPRAHPHRARPRRAPVLVAGLRVPHRQVPPRTARGLRPRLVGGPLPGPPRAAPTCSPRSTRSPPPTTRRSRPSRWRGCGPSRPSGRPSPAGAPRSRWPRCCRRPT